MQQFASRVPPPPGLPPCLSTSFLPPLPFPFLPSPERAGKPGGFGETSAGAAWVRAEKDWSSLGRVPASLWPHLDTETPADVSPSCWGENSVVNYA